MTLPVDLSLDAPGTYVFTAEAALKGHHLNAFGLSLPRPGNRAAFQADEVGYMRRAKLTEEQIALVRARDWTGLLRAGGHLQAMLKVAAAVGEDLWSIGAHNAGITREEMIALCPRRIDVTPEGEN